MTLWGRSDIVVQSGVGRLLLGRRGPHVPEHTGIEAFDAELRSRLGAPIPVDAPAEVSSAWTRDGFETALAPASVPERSLRRVWRDRLGRRAIPLLLVAPGLSDSACVAVVGPREGELQEVPPTDLAELINSAKDPDVIAPIQVNDDSLLVRTVLEPAMPYPNARVAVRRHDQLPPWLLSGWVGAASQRTEAEIEDPERRSRVEKEGETDEG